MVHQQDQSGCRARGDAAGPGKSVRELEQRGNRLLQREWEWEWEWEWKWEWRWQRAVCLPECHEYGRLLCLAYGHSTRRHHKHGLGGVGWQWVEWRRLQIC